MNRILEMMQYVRHVMDQTGTMLTDEQALQVIDLYNIWYNSTSYKTNDRVRYNNILYKCLMDHTSQNTWTPDITPSLWTKVLIPDPNIIPKWEQPESTNLYMKGDKVIHNGITYQSLIDNNSWEPGVIGTELLWEKINN